MDIEIGDMHPDEVREATAMLARGMRDVPMNVCVYGQDVERRIRGLEILFRVLLPAMDVPPLCARQGGRIVGLLGRVPPNAPPIPVSRQIGMVPPLFFHGPASLGRLIRYLGESQKHVPRVAHWHVGPVGVDASLQGRGIGTMMMQAFCEAMDAQRQISCLETDTPANVRFYQRFGFETVEEAEIHGIHNWFMRRDPAGRS
ncbi:MAG: GNAT family N-acetyltransferase [Chloroflexota bacterium]|nr:MAG: hypothetical protein DLM70_01055 [Chloroflexota bacterium]